MSNHCSIVYMNFRIRKYFFQKKKEKKMWDTSTLRKIKRWKDLFLREQVTTLKVKHLFKDEAGLFGQNCELFHCLIELSL